MPHKHDKIFVLFAVRSEKLLMYIDLKRDTGYNGIMITEFFDENFCKPEREFPIFAHNHPPGNTPPGTVFVHMHYHRDFELLYIYEGGAQCEVNGRIFAAKAGDMILVNPYESHYAETVGDRFGYICLNFDISITGVPDSQKILDGRLAYPSYYPAADRFLPFIESAYNENAAREPGWKLRTAAALMTVFSYLTESVFSVEQGRNEDFSRRLIDYVSDNYTSNISSRDAAEFFGYTHCYFCRLMKSSFRVSFSEYLRIYRMSIAKNLLADHSVTETAMLAGYQDISRFSNDFRKCAGISPSRFRKNH